jgi:hypothetical protein
MPVMFNMVAYSALKSLIDEVAAVDDRLMPNEIETYRSLAMKYAEPVSPEATDVTCLEVILRNVRIRRGYDFDPATDGGRIIDLPRGKR